MLGRNEWQVSLRIVIVSAIKIQNKKRMFQKFLVNLCDPACLQVPFE